MYGLVSGFLIDREPKSNCLYIYICMYIYIYIYIDLRRSSVIAGSCVFEFAGTFYADCECNAHAGTMVAVEYYFSL